MKINEIPNIFQSKIRLAIMTSLIDGRKDFKQLKELTEATDGNLSTHLSKLEKDGYISSEKTFIQRKPRSSMHSQQLEDEDLKSMLSYYQIY